MPSLFQLESETTSPGMRQPTALAIVLSGRVQGLGVRPAIARLANELNLFGGVSNSNEGIRIHVEGPGQAIDCFAARLAAALPARAQIESTATRPADWTGAATFEIEPSDARGPLTARVPPDLAVCGECLQETSTPANRRYGYAFASCTACGPRYSLIESMPYDRQSTAMRHFEQCPCCRREFTRPADRRFHSQTNCCHDCGPRPWLTDRGGRLVARGSEAVQAAVEALRRGQIVAVRGVGGYQLIVDATSADAVRRLRNYKQRPDKPLAVMATDVIAVERFAKVDNIERAALVSPANPIVVSSVGGAARLPSDLNEGLNTIGVMLPTTPLHDAIARTFARPLVVTSGNVEGSPLCYLPGEARTALAGVADAWLDHDRQIVRPIDDSVVRIIAGKLAAIRLARGLAPLPLDLPAGSILALGGHQKSAIALSNSAQAVLGPHQGDLDSEATRVRYLEHIEALRALYGLTGESIVCDAHPDYFTTRWAHDRSCRAILVQHHHAHVAAAMLEQGWLDRQVLGVAWDGTGYGPDGTVWGGEFLVATASDAARVASLRPFVLPGGEIAVRQPWRIAVAVVFQALGAEIAAGLRFDGVSPRQVERIVSLVDKSFAWPRTSSAGRLFDAVAALTLGIVEARFEGHAAMLLEAACDVACDGQYAMPLCSSEPDVLDWRPAIRGLLRDLRSGTAPGAVAMRFHRCLAESIAAVAHRYPSLPVALCGGCFQNKMLTELTIERLGHGRLIAPPGTIPTNDGGLAAGQLAIAAARLQGARS